MVNDRIITAHRGAARHAPENTLAALRWTAQNWRRWSSAWVEVDAALLGDGTVVLFHDRTLDRCTNAKGELASLGVADLASIDAGGWFDSKFQGEPIPTLTEALGFIDSHGLSVNLEIKTHAEEGRALAEAVIHALRTFPCTPDRLRISSFNHDALLHAHALGPQIAKAPLYSSLAEDWREVAARCNAVAVNLNYRKITVQQLKDIRMAGYEVHLYTPNRAKDVEQLWTNGLSGVITDDPPVFVASPDRQ